MFRRSCRVCCSRAASTGCFAFSWIFWDPTRLVGDHFTGAGLSLCFAGCALRARAERPETPAGFQQPGEHRHHSDGHGRLADAQLFGKPVLAALALVAALYHTLNHACFKGLLFLGAGRY